MKHSKGPWIVDKTYGLIMAGDVEIAACHAGCGNDSSANAKLISAAPDMFEALEYILDVVGHDAAYDLTLAEKAIKKAKGEL